MADVDVCVGIEYVVDGQPKWAYCDPRGQQLPTRLKGGGVRWYRWGAIDDTYIVMENTPGYLRKFPPGSHVPLSAVKKHEWFTLEPKPLRIVASRFLLIDLELKPRAFPLARGEYIQGLLADILGHRRLYVVTVPVPPEHSNAFLPDAPWPRVVSARSPARHDT